METATLARRRRIALSKDVIGGLRAIRTEALTVMAIAAVALVVGLVVNLLF